LVDFDLEQPSACGLQNDVVYPISIYEYDKGTFDQFIDGSNVNFRVPTGININIATTDDYYQISRKEINLAGKNYQQAVKTLKNGSQQNVPGLYNEGTFTGFPKVGKVYIVILRVKWESSYNHGNYYNQILSTFKFINNPVSPETINALSVYKEGQLTDWEKGILKSFNWPKLKSFKTGEKTREVYLVDCEVTNDEIGVKLTGIPVEVSNVPNIAEITLKELVKNHFGGFPDTDEISSYSRISGRNYKNADSGINGLLLKSDGTLIVNFYDSVSAYGGGSSRVSCLGLSTVLTAKQFPSVKEVKMCIDKFDNCEMDFQP